MSLHVVHLSADYPDRHDAAKTPVIDRLVLALNQRGCRQLVLSLNRTASRSAESRARDGDLVTIRYFGLPLGALQLWSLHRLARQLYAEFGAEMSRDSVIIAHKFAVEGVIAYFLARLAGCRFVVACMGNSDLKMIRAKPHYSRLYARIARQAVRIAFCTPWSYRAFAERIFQPLGLPLEKAQVVPFISYDRIEPQVVAASRPTALVSIFHYKAWKLKNLERMVAAVMRLVAGGRDNIQLDIIGSGCPQQIAEVQQVLRRHRAVGHVNLLGNKSRTEIDALLPQYAAMVLPSYPESFGLVYIEALKSGVPIMCARNAGFDGFFSAAFPGVIVAHDDTPSIAAGMIDLIDRNQLYRDRISGLSKDLQAFAKEEIVDAYMAMINTLGGRE